MASIFQPAAVLLLCSAGSFRSVSQLSSSLPIFVTLGGNIAINSNSESRNMCRIAMESENKLLNESTKMCKMHKKLQCSFRGDLHVNSRRVNVKSRRASSIE